MRVAGIDGCKDGWVAVIVNSGDFASASCVITDNLINLYQEEDLSFGLVDAPIGLGSRLIERDVDSAMRQYLKGKTSSVFNAPSKAASKAKTYEEACELNAADFGKKLSKQSWAIVPKIREAEQAAKTLHERRVREGHPEVSFAVFRGQPILSGKKTAKGMCERIGIIAKIGFDFEGLALGLEKKTKVSIDDLLDATILSWSAHRVIDNNYRSFPQRPHRDEDGLEMAVLA